MVPRHEIPDALTSGPPRGRGAAINPANRFEDIRLHVLGDHLDDIAAEAPDGTRIVTRVYRDHSKTILNHYESPDMGAGWSLNPYRGCEHGCIYCYARPSHEYLGLSSGVDFETKIVAKLDAPDLLRTEFARDAWLGHGLMFSGVTDPYQPVEQKLQLTRRILEVCIEFAQPISLITKNKLITRDLDLFLELHKHHAVHAALSITSLDNKLASTMEPRASSPRDRLAAVRTLAAAGIPTTVMVAPIIPALNESEIPAILEAARDAGAEGAGMVLLRLPWQNKELFSNWLEREFPDRANHVLNAMRDMHEGKLYRSEFFVRHTGSGPRAEQITQVFNLFARKLGFNQHRTPTSNAEFLRRKELRQSKGQMGLFA